MFLGFILINCCELWEFLAQKILCNYCARTETNENTFFLRLLDIQEKAKKKIISAGVTTTFNKCACKNTCADKFQITIKGTESFCLF